MHPQCTSTCEGNTYLTIQKEKVTITLEEIRALLILKPTFHNPTSRDEARNAMYMYPLEYKFDYEEATPEAVQAHEQWLKEIREKTKLCSYEDKKKEVIYVDEWVSIFKNKPSHKTLFSPKL